MAAERRPPIDFSGLAFVEPDADGQRALVDMAFQQPKGRNVQTTALGIGSGLLLAGRTMPQMLPDGLGERRVMGNRLQR